MSGEASPKELKPGTLEHLAAEFRIIARRASIAVAHLDAAGVAERPSLSRWSVAENLTHLTLSSEAVVPLWRESIEKARADGRTGKGPFKLDMWGTFWVWFLEPPPKVRMLSPKSLVPVAMPKLDRVLSTFVVSQQALLAAIETAEGLALDRILAPSLYKRRARHSMWSSFWITMAHQRRHLWQAEMAADQVAKRGPG